MIPRPILVLGHPRSGTSVVCGLLASAGVWVGPHEPEITNPTGTFENDRLRNLPSPLWGHLVRHVDAEHVMREQGYPGGPCPWLVKLGDPARWWRWSDMDPITIKVRRTHSSILASALARKQTKGVEVGPDYTTQLSNRIFRAVERMQDIPGYTVWPENLAHGRADEFERLFHELNLRWDMSFWEPGLWHH